MAFHVYILQNDQDRFYIGQTGNLDARLEAHNSSLVDGVTYPRKHGPWRLVWSEKHDSRASAMRRERQIKRMKSSRWIREQLLSGG